MENQSENNRPHRNRFFCSQDRPAIAVGISMGVGIGISINNLALGIAIGIALFSGEEFASRRRDE
ncbi:MAG TPA: hypothetical protein VKU38_10225 [Ktedonobacteraceae bacterium]|nr:hypothetical protein [Ktedonobacteraceae bacterium]